MPLGTIDRTPPPFFRQGPSALTKLVLCSALAVFLMAADTRFKLTQPLRAALATALLPMQRALQVPVALVDEAAGYLQGLAAARAGERAARQRLAQQSLVAARADQLAGENARLRSLLALRPALQLPSLSAEVMYEAADPYSRKLVIDRGGSDAIVAGAPVINEAGVLGQVTRVYPLTSVVTLLVDKDAAIPVLNRRTQQRGVAYGGADAAGQGGLELRFLAANADVRVGDDLVTSGLDGIYPAGLAVARVARVDRRADSGFARVLLEPAAGIDGVRHVLVLQPLSAQRPARADAADGSDDRELPARAKAARAAARGASAASASGSAAASRGGAASAAKARR